MLEIKFVASSPFDIGDRIKVDGEVKTITDIACVHYALEGVETWYYQLDNEKDYWHQDRFTINLAASKE